jgi:hypothetical protein
MTIANYPAFCPNFGWWIYKAEINDKIESLLDTLPAPVYVLISLNSCPMPNFRILVLVSSGVENMNCV